MSGSGGTLTKVPRSTTLPNSVAVLLRESGTGMEPVIDLHLSDATYNQSHMAISLDTATLEAALIGYRQQLQHIDAKMAELRRTLSGSAGEKPVKQAAAAPGKKKRRMSAEGRARIAAAQRARWAKVKNAG